MPLLLITTHQPRAHTAIAKKTTTTKKKHDDNSNSNRFTTQFHTHFDGLQMPYGVWQISGRIIRFYEAFLCDSPIEPIRALARSLALTQLNWLTRFYAVHYLWRLNRGEYLSVVGIFLHSFSLTHSHGTWNFQWRSKENISRPRHPEPSPLHFIGILCTKHESMYVRREKDCSACAKWLSFSITTFICGVTFRVQ